MFSTIDLFVVLASAVAITTFLYGARLKTRPLKLGPVRASLASTGWNHFCLIFCGALLTVTALSMRGRMVPPDFERLSLAAMSAALAFLCFVIGSHGLTIREHGIQFLGSTITWNNIRGFDLKGNRLVLRFLKRGKLRKTALTIPTHERARVSEMLRLHVD